MGYIIALVLVVVVVPLVFMLLSRRTPAGGGGVARDHRSVIREEPSADEPTPGAPGSINQPRASKSDQIPPA